ncbi:MAG: gliding motility protein GldD [Dysgonamonadaceae bacterium]|jgi:gliding motility-associated lipoprotein GldD|nr:gliding motility protein GldD [Dysgonamonadaceae bacterium]
MSNKEPQKSHRRFVIRLLLPVACSLFAVACSESTPKPSGYFRIDLPPADYHPENHFAGFTFALSDHAAVRKISRKDAETFFNIRYDRLQAEIYCSYLPVKKGKLAQLSEESRKFVYLHAAKAEAIQEQFVGNPQRNVYGTVYYLKGNVASPTQFVLTDSVSTFFRGALYFDHRPNADSTAPVLEYINKDIQVIIESFQWKK